ncbi:hypothetical protein ACFPER_06575 [Agromyces aurantiacus]|uniref:Uncharacterized protein n=1 Tax=Agromyces aurantiacus TaxID=165814 RepID=A0ABV9R2U3_9MICO|nr:hypothetical protein [Agromyces aurantiacus]MBM7503129.1 outer membrane murein-binding lipoprotein Lpp [Agromyces aurantiacus]
MSRSSMRHAFAGRAAAVAGLALLSTQLLSGCANLATQDLCAQYDDLVAAVDDLREKDPATTKVDDLRAAADEVSQELDQFQAVAEGRLDDALTRLRDEVDAVRQAAVDAGADARETAAPLIEDSVQRVRDAWSIVQGLAETQCPQ